MAPNEHTPLLDSDPFSSRLGRPAASQPLVLSIAEAARALGVPDDLVYELTERGELPCLRLGRRKVIPSRAIEIAVDAALRDFDPAVVLAADAARTKTDADRVVQALSSARSGSRISR